MKGSLRRRGGLSRFQSDDESNNGVIVNAVHNDLPNEKTYPVRGGIKHAIDTNEFSKARLDKFIEISDKSLNARLDKLLEGGQINPEIVTKSLNARPDELPKEGQIKPEIVTEFLDELPKEGRIKPEIVTEFLNARADELPKQEQIKSEIATEFLNVRPDELLKGGQIKPEIVTESLNAPPDDLPKREQIKRGVVPEFLDAHPVTLLNAPPPEDLTEVIAENSEQSPVANIEIRVQQKAKQKKLEKKVKFASVLALTLSAPAIIASAGTDYMNMSVINHGKLILDRVSIGSSLFSIFVVIGLFYSLQEANRVGTSIQERLIMLAIISAAMSIVSLAMIAFI